MIPRGLLHPTCRWLLLVVLGMMPSALAGQGVTTSTLGGLVTASEGAAPAEAIIVALHVPSGTTYRAVARSGGVYNIPNMRVGGPYRVTATAIGFQPRVEENVFLSLGQTFRLDFAMIRQAVQLAELSVVGARDEVLNAGRNGAATFIDPAKVTMLPSIKRSTRDLTRLDPRSDGNFSFGGRNWLYNNVSLDGSYFNNSFGLDDPAPGGPANAEPVPFDAIEQVQVSVAPFDVRQGGFTGANVNTVTKSGTNQFRVSAFSFYGTEALTGNRVHDQQIIANPDQKYLISGLAVSGPLRRNKLSSS